MSSIPDVSVLMPVFNAEKFLKIAIESILNQTYQHFELIIVDDGSTDSSPNIVKSFDHEKIRYYKNDTNIGLIATLNRGINLCSGKYIARMDADDISLPTRLEEQVAFLNNNSDYVLIGSNTERIDSEGILIRKKKYYCEANLIRTKLFFKNTFAHSSVMIRKEIFDEFRYDSRYIYAEDYHLWIQLASKYRIANLNKTLVRYRVHNESISAKKNVEQKATIQNIQSQILAEMQIIATAKELDLHYRLLNTPQKISLLDLNERRNINTWIDRLKTQNKLLKIYNETFFEKMLDGRWSILKQLHILFLKIIKKK